MTADRAPGRATRPARRRPLPPPGVLLRAVRDATWRPALAGALVGILLLGVGMTVASAVMAALAAATLVAVVLRVDTVVEPRPVRRIERTRDGVRGEVQDLAWSMAGRDGRAGERPMRYLRTVAARRAARHGVDLHDPEQADAAVALLGARAYATVTRRRHPLPTVNDLVHTLGVLERLGPTRTRPTPEPPRSTR